MILPYAYGTIIHTIRVWLYHMRIRVWYIPYAYGTKYAYGIEQKYLNSKSILSSIYGINRRLAVWHYYLQVSHIILVTGK